MSRHSAGVDGKSRYVDPGQTLVHDLRERVVAAIVTGGMSCDRAAKRFGVGISTAINWAKRVRETGNLAPGKTGGHKVSGEHHLWLLQGIKDVGLSLGGLVGELVARGLKVDLSVGL